MNAKILISGICGFVGSTIAAQLKENQAGAEIFGFDNFIRPGSELNRLELKRRGIRVLHADVRSASDVASLPPVDWLIDAAANPSVLAGVDGQTSSRQVVEHNLYGTINLLEFCKAHHAGFVLLSTSRVYAIKPLAELKVEAVNKAFRPDAKAPLPPGISAAGVDEHFSTSAPISLYGSTKLASETMALEYGETFDFPVWINRCGVLAGAGQFGRPDQGIFSFWINSWLRKRPLKYLGFGGNGFQVRDCLHPKDIVALLIKQFGAGKTAHSRIVNVSGGIDSAMSLAQLSDWCAARFGRQKVQADGSSRPFDIPWMVLNPALARKIWNWQPQTSLENVLDEIARHAEKHPDWLDLSAP
ncbi:MAG TPA: NAD-dependent epimerase/dehydratase family protein [Verrucomicrobiae bacterium]|nr:NAD-dependent epimerase/dehydratase family protein [Verrucomicrobiae bacterium]